MIVSVRVRAAAKLTKIEQISENQLNIWTTTAPDKGKANHAVIKLLAKHFDVRPSSIELVRGHTSFQKQFSIQKHSD